MEIHFLFGTIGGGLLDDSDNGWDDPAPRVDSGMRSDADPGAGLPVRPSDE